MTYRIPPLNALRAFEAAARHLSFKQAAAELHVTPGAVSQQVKALEADLGVALLARKGNSFQLTEHALRGRDHLSGGLRMLQQGVERMRHRPQLQRIH
jgi:LysR family glycine cleavage system transcriptional activator